MRGLLALVWATSLLQIERPARAAERQALQGHVPAVAGRLQALERLAGTNRLELVIGLPLRNRQALSQLLQEMYDPANPNYHRYLTPEQFAERFGPTKQDYEAVIAFAKANGLTLTGTHPNRTLLDVSGSVECIENALHLRMRRYQHPSESRKFYAPDAEPSLDLAVPVLAINGLDDLTQPHPMNLRATPFKSVPQAIPYANGTGPRGNLIGRDFRAAYVPDVSMDGSGQTVGLLEFDSYYPSDILAYESLAGLPNVLLTNVLLNG